jgi:peptidoglycan/LPS O-acetylase OafA/YrhL
MTASSTTATVVTAARPAVAPHSSLNYLSCLQAYRGLAALAVLLFHIDKLFRTKLGIELAGGKFFHAGYLGVDFFFC